MHDANGAQPGEEMTGVAATQQQEEYRDRLYRQNHHGTNLLKAGRVSKQPLLISYGC